MWCIFSYAQINSTDINECDSTCNGNNMGCNNIDGGYNCTCNKGFEMIGATCEGTF